MDFDNGVLYKFLCWHYFFINSCINVFISFLLYFLIWSCGGIESILIVFTSQTQKRANNNTNCQSVCFETFSILLTCMFREVWILDLSVFRLSYLSINYLSIWKISPLMEDRNRSSNQREVQISQSQYYSSYTGSPLYAMDSFLNGCMYIVKNVRCGYYLYYILTEWVLLPTIKASKPSRLSLFLQVGQTQKIIWKFVAGMLSIHQSAFPISQSRSTLPY